jgi:membrane protease YdiL (CAAX protease family)
VLLKLTIGCEHKVMDWFKARGGGAGMTALKYFVAWLILFGSKFVILEALVQVFGDKVRFEGRFDGIVTLIVVIVVMLLAEELIVRLYRKLGDAKQT